MLQQSAATVRLTGKKTTPPQTGTGSLIGYARVSTDDQDCAAQVWELRKAGCTEIIQEYGSGADKHRPALARLLGSITAGDTLVIVRLDRLARSLMHLMELIDILTRRGAALRSLRDPIDTGSPAGRFSMHILGAAAEFERALLIERTRAGIAAAAAPDDYPETRALGHETPPPPSSSPHTDAHDIWNVLTKFSAHGFPGSRNNVPQPGKPSPEELQLQAALAGPANDCGVPSID